MVKIEIGEILELLAYLIVKISVKILVEILLLVEATTHTTSLVIVHVEVAHLLLVLEVLILKILTVWL